MVSYGLRHLVAAALSNKSLKQAERIAAPFKLREKMTV
jgi:hypothetical protein